MTPKSAFPVGEATNVSSLKNAVNKNALTLSLAMWLATAVGILERAGSHEIQAAVQLESQVCKCDEENQTLLKEKFEDQKTIIGIQNQTIEIGQDTNRNFKEIVQTEVKLCA